jgi:ureidoacrylate peracid hydrolase
VTRHDGTTLLVIDPVNDFLSEGGADWQQTKRTVRMNDVIGHLKLAIGGARERAIPVLFAPMAYTEEDYADERLQRRSGINRYMFERRMFLAGSWGADFHPELRPRDDEPVLLPHKGVDVFETDLPEHLDRLGTTDLVIAGMTANLCCESTGRRAMERGYDVTFLSNAIGASNVPAYEASIRVNYPLIANAVMDVEEWLATLDARASGTLRPQPGDNVRASDRLKLGTVTEVRDGAGDEEPHMVVRRRVGRPLFVPLDAVVRRSAREVVLNVPWLLVPKLPWRAAPRRAARTALLGPVTKDVDRLYRSRDPSQRAPTSAEQS